MPVLTESNKVGRCYLMETGHLCRVVALLPDGRVQHVSKGEYSHRATWKPGMEDDWSFPLLAEREVPCDRTPEMDEEEQSYASRGDSAVTVGQ